MAGTDPTPEQLAAEVAQLREQLEGFVAEGTAAAKAAGQAEAKSAIALFEDQIKGLPQAAKLKELIEAEVSRQLAAAHAQSASTAPATNQPAIRVRWWIFAFVVPGGALILAWILGGMLTQLNLAWGYDISTYVLLFLLLLVVGLVVAFIVARFPAKTPRRAGTTEPLTSEETR